MKSPKVSIIIPCYNVEKYLDRCMNSLANNTYDNKEIIFINDGSNDSTSSILDNYKDKYTFVKVIHKKNEGVSKARNSGLSNADGEYVMFVDPDDYVEPNFIAKASQEMEHSNCDMIMFGFNTDWTGRMEPVLPLEHYNLSSNAQIIKSLFPRIYGLSLGRFHKWLRGERLMPEKETGQIWRWIYRRSFLNKNNITFQDVKVGEDMVFNAECLLAAESLKSIDDCLYNYFPRKDGLMYSNINGLDSLRNKQDMLKQRIRLGNLLEHKTGEDSLSLFGGSCIMSCFELAFILSKSNEYKAFVSYVKNTIVQECISRSKIGYKNIKAVIPFLLLKLRANRTLFYLFWLVNKLNVKISY